MNLTEQEQDELLELIKRFNKTRSCDYKIVYLDKAAWTNVITKKKGVINDLFFMGEFGRSIRPKCILEIRYKGKTYKIHDRLNHVNLHEDVEDTDYSFDGDYMDIKYQSFCNPVTAHQVYEKPGIDKILKGQLSGQNSNSPFQAVRHVTNEGIDYAVQRTDGLKMTNRAAIIELLTRKSPYELRTIGKSTLATVKVPNNEDEIAVKYKREQNYRIIRKDELEENKDLISEYYPIITYEQTKDMWNAIPKQNIDMTVVGLGSAGTGILDQVARSTYIKEYFLIDFDVIERKNLRNQWYRKAHIGAKKASSSKDIICQTKYDEPNVYVAINKFQNVPLDAYKSKYVVSGFDNLECRMELLDKCLNGFESKYLIDVRYLDYSSSIYFVDLENEKQVKYYRNLLQADIEAFNEQEEEKERNKKYISTKEELCDYLKRRGCFDYACGDLMRQLGVPAVGCGSEFHCESDACKERWWNLVQTNNVKIELPQEEEESSCVRENFIDIYKYSSSFVFAAIREIEAGNDKPFTHIEAQTEVIPTSVVVRR